MSEPAITDWDDAYANAPYIADAAEFPARWSREAAAFRAGARSELDIAYGAGPRERFDLFFPEGDPRGLAMFVHGGYWHLPFAKEDWSHLAAGVLARGWAMALPSYPLCPDVHVGDIVRAVARAGEAAAVRVAGPIALTGHSAGGHVVARLVCADAPLAPEIAQRVVRAAPISGVFDLRPLMRTRMNETLRLDAAEAAGESPALMTPRGDVGVSAFVGADERPELLRQTALLAAAWPQAQARTVGGRHHFDVIDALTDPEGEMVKVLVGK